MTHDPLAEAIRLIGGNSPPEWLKMTLEPVPARLRELREAADTFPTRDKLRHRLAEAIAGAKTLEGALTDPTIIRFLENARPTPPGGTPVPLMRFLDVLHDWVQPALQGAHDGIRGGRGGDKTYPNAAGLQPREMTAAWVAVAWDEVKKRRVPYSGSNAQKACQQLWRAAGGDTRENLAVWRKPLEKARDMHAAKQLAAISDQFLGARTRLYLFDPETPQTNSTGADKNCG